MAARRLRNNPPPEPVVEPEPEKIELDPKPETVPEVDEDDPKKSSTNDASEKNKCPEKIIERIIICPGGQDGQQSCGYSRNTRPYHFHPPPPPVICCKNDCSEKKSKKKTKKRDQTKKDGDMSEITVLQDKKTEKPLYPRPKPQVACQCTPSPPPSPVIIYQRPVICCCKKSSSDDSDDDDEENEEMIDTATFISFANMVFAAANVMTDYPEAY